MKTKIIISREATMTAEGKHINGNSKSIGCVELGIIWPSVGDAAKTIGTHGPTLSHALNHKDGVFKGMHFFFVSDGAAVMPKLMTHIQNDAEDARKWREYQAKLEAERKAEQERLEAERKAKEQYEAAVAKAEAKLARRKEIYERKLAEAKLANERVAQAEQELYNLLNEKEVEVA